MCAKLFPQARFSLWKHREVCEQRERSTSRAANFFNGGEQQDAG